MMGKKDEESRDILDRVQRDSETFGSSSLRRMTDHFTGRDAIGEAEGGGTDPIELWGRRIGRTLSVIGVIVLTYWLAVQLKLV
ncbi:hypothetical protein [Microvirga rosea]|uniref:hypothetical protein n=1 Tax=Microvirga rosea TaxID=2715425 RepID=UPI001D0A086C|nr:hypothetical protein [Microvirga rosea]MCB8819131.1 hypothetical protein [Microvirga rosea]